MANLNSPSRSEGIRNLGNQPDQVKPWNQQPDENWLLFVYIIHLWRQTTSAVRLLRFPKIGVDGRVIGKRVERKGD